MKRVFPVFLIFAAMTTGCKENKSNVKLDHEQYVLDNGLKVVLHEDKSDPVVAVAIQYNVGSKNEKPGKTGFAHFFEHMLFQRSENLPRNAFFQKIDALGGIFNGSTSNDGTNYYEAVPRDALEKVLWMESDRMGYFINTVTQGGLEREIDVVVNEKRQYENAPYGMTNELLFKNMFPAGHPYSWTVIGEIADLRTATVDDVKEFYNTYYSPSNATLAIAGDFDKDEVKALVQKYFGDIPARPTPEKLPVQNVVLDSVKRVYYEDAFANSPLALQVFPGVEAYHPDGYALDFLTNILAADKKSPLYKVLVEERKLMPSVSMFNYQLMLAGMVVFNGTTFEGVNLDDVHEGIQEAFVRFEKDGVREEDLRRYKIAEKTRIYNDLTSVMGKAMALANNNEFTGRPDQNIRDLAMYEAVTAEDVMRVYEKYIKGRNYVFISIVPKGESHLALSGSVPVIIEQEQIHQQEMSSEAGAIVDDPYERTPSALDRSVEPALLSNTPQLHIPQIWTSEMPGGMIVKGIKYDELPLVYFAIELNSGMLHDSVGKEGAAYFTAQMLNEGTALKTPEELEEAIGQLGARINFICGSEYMSVTGNCLEENFGEVMALVEEMLLKPRWDETAFETVKGRIIDDLRHNATEPKEIGNKLFRRLLFGSNNILSSLPKGNIESVGSLKMEDLKEFYGKFLSSSSARVSYVGGDGQKSVEKTLSSLVKQWETKEIPAPAHSPSPAKKEAKIFFVDYPGSTQSYIVMGNRSMPANDPDAYKAYIVNDRLGGSSNGLLFEVLRLQRGYTYGAYSSFTTGNHIHFFSASSSVQAVVTKESVDLFREIIQEYGESYGQQELDNSTSSLLRKLHRQFEVPDALLGMLREIFIYDRPDNYISVRENTLNTMTLDQAHYIIDRHFDFDSMIIVVVGDARTQFDNLKKLDIGEVILVTGQGDPVK